VLFHRFNEGADMWLADLPQTVTAASHPVIFLGYWHYRLLNYLLIPSSLSTDILWTAQEAFTLLTAEPFFLSPFTHHFTCLAGLALADLTKVDKTRDESTRIVVNDLLEGVISPSGWDAFIRDRVAERLRPLTSSGLDAASQGLQHLADLATATGLTKEKANEGPVVRAADGYEDMGFDPRPMLRAGYLNAIRPTTQP